MNMKRIIPVLAFIYIFYFGYTHFYGDHETTHKTTHKTHQEKVISQKDNNPKYKANKEKVATQTYNTPGNGQQFSGSGEVIKVLSDDNKGSKHQRFILRLPSGQTILIAHNIDIAQRIPSLRVGEIISFNGVYETNSKGGVVHWTHRDPKGRHNSGWLQKNGQTYQ
jgi:hypothetical protein